MPAPVGQGLTTDHVLRALADIDHGVAHPSGRGTTRVCSEEAFVLEDRLP